MNDNFLLYYSTKKGITILHYDEFDLILRSKFISINFVFFYIEFSSSHFEVMPKFNNLFCYL